MIVRGRSPNLLGSPDRSKVVFCQFLLVIGLHDQWVYPSLSNSSVKWILMVMMMMMMMCYRYYTQNTAVVMHCVEVLHNVHQPAC